MRLLSLPVLVTLAALAVARPARAEPAVEHETARALMDDGDRHFQAGDFIEARAIYVKARALVRAPTTGLAVAEAEEHLGLFVEARDSALEVTRMPVVALEPAVFAESRALARALADRVVTRIGVVALTLRREAECGAPELSVDGATWPEEALGAPLHVNPGRHRIQARAAGCAAIERAVDVSSGATVPLLLELRPAVVAPPPPPPAGPSPAAARNGAPTGALVLLGVGAVGLAVGVTAGIVSLSKTASVRDTCGGAHCAAGDGDYRTASTTAWISDGGFVVGLLGAGAGVLWIVLAKKSPTSARLTPGPRGASLVVPFM